MKSLVQRLALAVALAVPLLLATRSEACGPDCGEDEDSSGSGRAAESSEVANCLSGMLGDIALQGPRCRAMGFLWMHGMTPEDQQLMASSFIPDDPADSPDPSVWKEARAKVSVPAPQQEISTGAPIGDAYFENCLTSAFQVAAKTLEERIAKFGARSPEVANWVKAQDAVFANCGGGERVMPEPAPTNASPLLRADRAYQTAAALFYAMDYDAAIQALDQIAADSASPWRGWARLAAVRALIRQSTLKTAQEDQKRALLEKARERCVAIVKDPGMKDLHRQTRQLTWFIDYRLRPDKQLNLLGRALLEKPDANFGYAFRDYFLLRGQKLPSTDELSTFLDVLEKDDSYPQAIAEWKKAHALPWLVAALSRARGKEPELPQLLAQSESIPRVSPAYVSVHGERARLALANGRLDEARRELLSLLQEAADALPPQTVRRLSSYLREAALTFEEWAKYANHSPSEAADFFNQGVPLSRFKDAKMLAALEPKLRKDVVLAGWTRAVLLDRWEDEKALEPSVEKVAPELAADLAKVKARKSPDERKLAAVLLLLKSPGLSPLVRPSRTQYLRDYDSCSVNGWCGEAAVSDFYKGCDAAKSPCGTRFISVAERREVLSEREALVKLGKAPESLIRFTLDYAKSHPADELVPEALHESVQQTHYARNYCGKADEEGNARSELSKQAFQLLQRKYTKSEWAKKTPYHY